MVMEIMMLYRVLSKIIRLYVLSGSNTLRAGVFDGTNWKWEYAININTNDNNKIALRWGSDVLSLFVNGIKQTGATNQSSFTFSGLDKLNLAYFNNADPFLGNVKQIINFPTALTDAECISLTS